MGTLHHAQVSIARRRNGKAHGEANKVEVALKTVSSDKVGIAHVTPGSSSADTPAPQCTGGGGGNREETERMGRAGFAPVWRLAGGNGCHHICDDAIEPNCQGSDRGARLVLWMAGSSDDGLGGVAALVLGQALRVLVGGVKRCRCRHDAVGVVLARD